eukprot:TRINITY_DN2081_c0_g1_i2.p1 TRINITY_DN2081_c0_g1~~TRINITY_DN2081_c0_g1_i2.p1  ORF type:complete len:768 (+),score=232.35 TRINITY_DN2081_c0_g1_i2:61-2364(+)
MGCAACVQCREDSEDKKLREDAAAAAALLDLLPNELAFAHELNRKPVGADDPRSAQQIAAAAAAKAADPAQESFELKGMPQFDEHTTRFMLQTPGGVMLPSAGPPEQMFVWPAPDSSWWNVRPLAGLSMAEVGATRSDAILVACFKTEITRAAIHKVKHTKRGTKTINKPAKTRDYWSVEVLPKSSVKAGGDDKTLVHWNLAEGYLEGTCPRTGCTLVPGWSKKRSRWEASSTFKKTDWRIVPESFTLMLLPKRLRATDHNTKFVIPKARLVREEVSAGEETPVRPETMGSELICFSMKLPYLLGSVPQDRWADSRTRFAALCEFAGAPLVDRTGKLGLGLNVKVLHPIPKMDPWFSKPLDQVIMERTVDLLRRSQETGVELHVLWSGGIDTTANVVGFLRAISDYPDAKVVIRYCDRSIPEYPLFWEKHLGSGEPGQCPFRCERIEGHVRDVVDEAMEAPQKGLPRRLIVTGDPGDMLMGTYVMALAFRGRKVGGSYNALHFGLDKPWQEVMPRLLHARGLLDGRVEKGSMARRLPMYDDWVRWIQPFVDEAPIPVVSAFDFLWWFTYGMKYTHDVLRVLYNRDTVSQELLDVVCNFYETEDFHQWSFHNHSAKMTDHRVWSSYKMPQKKFIHDFTGDDEYLKAKLKTVSAKNSWGYQFGIDDKFHVIRFGCYSSSVRRMYEKYNVQLSRYVVPDVPGQSVMRGEQFRDHVNRSVGSWSGTAAAGLVGVGLAGLLAGGALYSYGAAGSPDHSTLGAGVSGIGDVGE